MSRDNATWGAPRIHSELALLGHEIAESTVDKYMVRRPRQPSPSWRTFIANHMSVAAACDFFVVPTLTFKALYCFVVLSHDRRRILHINVTRHSTDEWTSRQILEAFPGDALVPQYLHRDRDSIYGNAFQRTLAVLGIKQVISAKKSPWQNPYAERVIGSIRRECTDHTRPSRARARWVPAIPLGERHLSRVLRRYATYYNESRTHLALNCNSPLPRPIEDGVGQIVATPHLGGLHHRYARAA